MATPFEQFVIDNMPYKGILLTATATGYDGDPNDGGAPALFASAPLGTKYVSSTQLWGKGTDGVWYKAGLDGDLVIGGNAAPSAAVDPVGRFDHWTRMFGDGGTGDLVVKVDDVEYTLSVSNLPGPGDSYSRIANAITLEMLAQGITGVGCTTKPPYVDFRYIRKFEVVSSTIPDLYFGSYSFPGFGVARIGVTPARGRQLGEGSAAHSAIGDDPLLGDNSQQNFSGDVRHSMLFESSAYHPTGPFDLSVGGEPPVTIAMSGTYTTQVSLIDAMNAALVAAGLGGRVYMIPKQAYAAGNASATTAMMVALTGETLEITDVTHVGAGWLHFPPCTVPTGDLRGLTLPWSVPGLLPSQPGATILGRESVLGVRPAFLFGHSATWAAATWTGATFNFSGTDFSFALSGETTSAAVAALVTSAIASAGLTGRVEAVVSDGGPVTESVTIQAVEQRDGDVLTWTLPGYTGTGGLSFYDATPVTPVVLGSVDFVREGKTARARAAFKAILADNLPTFVNDAASESLAVDSSDAVGGLTTGTAYTEGGGVVEYGRLSRVFGEGQSAVVLATSLRATDGGYIYVDASKEGASTIGAIEADGAGANAQVYSGAGRRQRGYLLADGPGAAVTHDGSGNNYGGLIGGVSDAGPSSEIYNYVSRSEHIDAFYQSSYGGAYVMIGGDNNSFGAVALGLHQDGNAGEAYIFTGGEGSALLGISQVVTQVGSVAYAYVDGSAEAAFVHGVYQKIAGSSYGDAVINATAGQVSAYQDAGAGTPPTPATLSLGSANLPDGQVDITTDATGATANNWRGQIYTGGPAGGPLVVLSGGSQYFAVQLAKDGGGALDPAQNTAALVAAAITAYTSDPAGTLSAVATGTGLTPFTLDEGPTYFTGGAGSAPSQALAYANGNLSRVTAYQYVRNVLTALAQATGSAALVDVHQTATSADHTVDAQGDASRVLGHFPDASADGIASGDGAIQVGPGTNTEDNSLRVENANHLSRLGARGSLPQATTLGVAAATFVADGDVILLTGDGGGNTLTTITVPAAMAGLARRITVIMKDANLAITDDNTGTANTINLNAAYALSAANDVFEFVYDGTSWFEVSRSING